MAFQEGQGILGKIRFTDGEMPAYDRTYLIVRVTAQYIEVLNVSSLKGKERKLAYPENKRILRYDPPFQYPSFVKLDSLTRVYLEDWKNLRILCNGKTLNPNELNQIQSML